MTSSNIYPMINSKNNSLLGNLFSHKYFIKIKIFYIPFHIFLYDIVNLLEVITTKGKCKEFWRPPKITLTYLILKSRKFQEENQDIQFGAIWVLTEKIEIEDINDHKRIKWKETEWKRVKLMMVNHQTSLKILQIHIFYFSFNRHISVNINFSKKITLYFLI